MTASAVTLGRDERFGGEELAESFVVVAEQFRHDIDRVLPEHRWTPPDRRGRGGEADPAAFDHDRSVFGVGHLDEVIL